MRYGRSRMYSKRALWRMRAVRQQAKNEREEAVTIRVKKTEPKEVYKIKPIGGEKNGGTRKVRIHKLPARYATESLRQKQVRKPRKPKITKLRKSLTPGRVCIVVASAHKGKRVVFLKQLDSGLCLVTGPFYLNRCPIRRISQRYLMATTTDVDISKVKIPEHVNDEYFRRVKSKSKKATDTEDIFTSTQKKYVPSKERMHDTTVIDRQVMKCINRRKDGVQLVQYLCSNFGLQKHDHPHAMKF